MEVICNLKITLDYVLHYVMFFLVNSINDIASLLISYRSDLLRESNLFPVIIEGGGARWSLVAFSR